MTGERNTAVHTGSVEPADVGTSPVTGPGHVRVRVAGVTVDIEWQNAAHVDPPAGEDHPRSATAPTAENSAEVPADVHYIRSPIVGTFYHAPDPGSAPFVSPGDTVSAGQQVGIVEAMKLMNSIDADASGSVVEVIVPNGSPVEYDQELIAIKPD